MVSIEHINYIKAPVGLVYQALTTEEGLSNVWTRKLKVKPQLNFVNEFDFDDDYLTKMKVIELNEDTKIVWECLASDQEWVGTKVSFELTTKNNVTSVVLKHSNWADVTEFYRWCNYNWAMFLWSLKSYCENKKGLPFQDREF